MTFYMLPITDVRAGDVVEIAADSAKGPQTLRVPVSRTATVGGEVWIYSPKFSFSGGQPMPLYYSADAVVGVKRAEAA